MNFIQQHYALSSIQLPTFLITALQFLAFCSNSYWNKGDDRLFQAFFKHVKIVRQTLCNLFEFFYTIHPVLIQRVRVYEIEVADSEFPKLCSFVSIQVQFWFNSEACLWSLSYWNMFFAIMRKPVDIACLCKIERYCSFITIPLTWTKTLALLVISKLSTERLMVKTKYNISHRRY